MSFENERRRKPSFFFKTKSSMDSSCHNKIITYSQGATRDLLAKIIKIENETMILLNCYDMQNEDLPTFYKWELAFDYPFEFAKEKDIVRFDKNLVSFKKNYSQSFDELEVELGVQLVMEAKDKELAEKRMTFK